MKKLAILFSVLSLFFVAIGCNTERSNNEENEPPLVSKEDEEKTIESNEEKVINNIFEDPTVGDVVANMVITDVEISKEPVFTAEIEFENEVVITGTYKYDPDAEFLDGIMFIVGEESLGRIPKLKNDERFVWFGFKNDEEARKLLNIEDEVAIEGIATIKIDHYQINYLPTEVWNLATLVDVIK